MKLRNQILAAGSLAAATLLTAPAVAQAAPPAPPSSNFDVIENSPLLTATVTGQDAAITVTVPEGTLTCTTPVVKSGSLDADAIQQALDEFAANPHEAPTIPGLAESDLSSIIYPTLVSTDPFVFDPPMGPVINNGNVSNSPFTAELTALADGAYGAFTSCNDPTDPRNVDFYIRNFQVGEVTPIPDVGGTGSLANLFSFGSS